MQVAGSTRDPDVGGSRPGPGAVFGISGISGISGHVIHSPAPDTRASQCISFPVLRTCTTAGEPARAAQARLHPHPWHGSYGTRLRYRYADLPPARFVEC